MSTIKLLPEIATVTDFTHSRAAEPCIFDLSIPHPHCFICGQAIQPGRHCRHASKTTTYSAMIVTSLSLEVDSRVSLEAIKPDWMPCEIPASFLIIEKTELLGDDVPFGTQFRYRLEATKEIEP